MTQLSDGSRPAAQSPVSRIVNFHELLIFKRCELTLNGLQFLVDVGDDAMKVSDVGSQFLEPVFK